MQTFLIIWSGQFVSAIGSAMTQFALTVWVWQFTGQATSLALLSFFFQLPQIFVSLFAGLLVDRLNRKHLMILGDTCVALCTITIGILYSTQHLLIWHLYILAAVYGCFGHIQNLAYSASIALMVPKQQYLRASSMTALVAQASTILAPALAGSLYPNIGLFGIILVDIATFTVAISTLLFVQIPQPPDQEIAEAEHESLFSNLAFGFRYILSKPSLWAMTVAFSCFAFAHQIGETVYQPMILARTGGNAQILGLVVTAAGVGGSLGALTLSIWGGFKERIHGMLLGFIGAGLGRIILGLGQTPGIWIGAQLFASINLPILFSSSNAIWYAKIPPQIQGRVFAADHTIGMIIGAVASLIAGPLADRVFEPALQGKGVFASLFSPVFGTEAGAGMALLYVVTSIVIVFVGFGGYAHRPLRNAEAILPDHDFKETL